METKFQTSFIPKKPLIPTGLPTVSPHRRFAGLFMTFAVIVFTFSLLAAGGSYAWTRILVSTQNGYKQQLKEREQQFNIDLIEQLKRANVKIDLAKQLLRNHLAISQIFDIVSRFTIENVRFLNLDLTGPSAQNGDVRISMQGYGTSFSAVAFQSQVLGELEKYNLRKVVKNPIITDPSLDSGGTVSFGFSAALDSRNLSYEKLVTGSDIAPEETATSSQSQ